MPALGLSLGMPFIRYQAESGDGVTGENFLENFTDTPPNTDFVTAEVTQTEDTDPEGNTIFVSADNDPINRAVAWKNCGNILLPGNTISIEVIVDVASIILSGAIYFHPFQIFQESPATVLNAEFNIRILPGVPTSFNQFTKDPNLTGTPSATDLGGGFYKYAWTGTVGGGYSVVGDTHVVVGRVADPATATGSVRVSSAGVVTVT